MCVDVGGDERLNKTIFIIECVGSVKMGRKID